MLMCYVFTPASVSSTKWLKLLDKPVLLYSYIVPLIYVNETVW